MVVDQRGNRGWESIGGKRGDGKAEELRPRRLLFKRKQKTKENTTFDSFISLLPIT